MTVEATTTALTTLPSGSGGTTISPNSTPWNNSSWTQVTASASSDLTLAAITVEAGTGQEFEIDIATGAAASEVVVASVPGHFDSQAGVNTIMYFPVPISNISSGDRVSIRLQHRL